MSVVSHNGCGVIQNSYFHVRACGTWRMGSNRERVLIEEKLQMRGTIYIFILFLKTITTIANN